MNQSKIIIKQHKTLLGCKIKYRTAYIQLKREEINTKERQHDNRAIIDNILADFFSHGKLSVLFFQGNHSNDYTCYKTIFKDGTY